jgi:hypothetical protein
MDGGDGISLWAFMGAGCVYSSHMRARAIGGETRLVFATTGFHCRYQDGAVAS